MNDKEFVLNWIKYLNNKGIKKFPDSFLNTTAGKTISLPRQSLMLGEELFGVYEVLTTDGSSIIQTQYLQEAKYIVYANRDKPPELFIPLKEKEISRMVNMYEQYLDSIIREIEADYIKVFPEGMNKNLVVNEIFRSANLIRL